MSHLNLNLFAFRLQHTYEVNVLLVELVIQKLSKPNYALKLALDACLLPNFSYRSSFKTLTLLY